MTVKTPFSDWEKAIPRRSLVDRDSFILEACKRRNVIHLGACDSPMTLDKSNRGELLHQKLQLECRSLVGIDIDQESIALLEKTLGITNILHLDLSRNIELPLLKADVVVCADIIEHVSNVGQLIENCRHFLQPESILIISTINASSFKQAVRALIGREPVHPDHIAYYSYATLGALMARYGLEIVDCRYFSYRTVTKLAGGIFNLLHRLAPPSSDGIVISAKMAQPSATR